MQRLIVWLLLQQKHTLDNEAWIRDESRTFFANWALFCESAELIAMKEPCMYTYIINIHPNVLFEKIIFQLLPTSFWQTLYDVNF